MHAPVDQRGYPSPANAPQRARAQNGDLPGRGGGEAALATHELDGNGVGVAADGAEVLVLTHAASVHLLGVHTILGVEVLDLAGGEHAVEAGIRLELVAELGGESEALLLAGELQEVGALAHDGGTAGGHLEDLLLLRLPGDHVELLNLSLAEEAAGGAAEDGGGGVGVKGRLDPGGLLLLGGGSRGLLSAHDEAGGAHGQGLGGAHGHGLALESGGAHVLDGRDAGHGGDGHSEGGHGGWMEGRDGCERQT
mmetsp:Transcript_780/g.2775  ORF Transcript_780/g.2775 Transcript_780/m.2775 type:complete len:252 (+) Transcript_780:827-1582(+)